MYSFALDIRMHSSTKESFRLEMAIGFVDAPNSYNWLAVSPDQDSNDGWVHCTADYQFPEYQSIQSKIEVYLVRNDSSDHQHDGVFLPDANIDNFSASFKSGPVSDFVTPEPVPFNGNKSLLNDWVNPKTVPFKGNRSLN